MEGSLVLLNLIRYLKGARRRKHMLIENLWGSFSLDYPLMSLLLLINFRFSFLFILFHLHYSILSAVSGF